MLQSELLIGAVGWEHENWIGSYYPADLPEDWRFGYYSNQLRSVLLPEEFWQQQNLSEQIELVRDDLYADFRMVLQWSVDEAITDIEAARLFLDKCQPFDANVDAFLVDVSGSDQAAVTRAIETLQNYRPVCISTNDADLEKACLEIEGVSRIWRADLEDSPMQCGQFLVALTTKTDLKEIRFLIEKINAWPQGLSSVRGAALYFENTRAGDTAFQARTIAELMGV